MGERFWKHYLRRDGFGLWSILTPVFWLVSLCYMVGNRIDRALSSNKVTVPVPVVSVGNLTVGGTGKTPLVIHLARLLASRPLRVGIVTSGYGRSSKEEIVGTGADLDSRPVSELGDEAKLLTSLLPTTTFAIASSKARAAELLASTGAVDIILVDDGFQHYRLNRTLDIVALDASLGPSAYHLLPLGMLREPHSALKRAGLIVITHTEQAHDLASLRELIATHSRSAVLFEARYINSELVGQGGRFPMTLLKDKKALVFAGIGNFGAFADQVNQICGQMAGSLEFADHQEYDSAQLAKVRDAAIASGAEIIVTTGKDWVKTGGFDFGVPCYYLDLNLEFTPSDEQLIASILRLTTKKADAH